MWGNVSEVPKKMQARFIAGLMVLALLSTGASYRTQNFVIHAPNPQIAQQVGQYAEHYRKEKALEWLGQEMPPWSEPCPVKVTVTINGAGGATSFAFDQGRVLGQDMQVEGPLDRILVSVLPHEITHTVFAYYFKNPVPRWADEGGCVLSEDELEKQRHDAMTRDILATPGRKIPLRRLFSMTKYPNDVMVLYAEGFSVSEYLVSIGGKQTFLGFVGYGMQYGWDAAAKAYYRFNTIEHLEESWIAYLRNHRPGQGQNLLASNAPKPGNNWANQSLVVTRQTLPPTQPVLEAPKPVYRGSSPIGDENPSIRPAYPQANWSQPGQFYPAAAPIESSGIRLGAPVALPKTSPANQ